MTWDVAYTDEFGDWWESLSENEQDKVAVAVQALEEFGPNLSFPLSSGIRGSKHPHMRELRIQQGGRPLRVLYAFNPERTAVLLLGGDKTGDARWYDVNVALADKIYDEHIAELKKRGATDG